MASANNNVEEEQGGDVGGGRRTPPSGPNEFGLVGGRPIPLKPPKPRRRTLMSSEVKAELKRRSRELREALLSSEENKRPRLTSPATNGGQSGCSDQEEMIYPLGVHIPTAEERKEFEEKRIQNIREKNEFLKMHGFKPALIVGIQAPLVKPKRPPVKRVKRANRTVSIPHTMSLRSSNSQGRVDMKNEPVSVKEEKEEEEEEEKEEKGPIKMVPVNYGEDDKKHGDFIMNLLPELEKTLHSSDDCLSLDLYKRRVMSLKLKQNSIKKVGMSRTISMAIHPSESKVLIVAGDGLGNIGLWDVNNDEDPMVYRPHKSSVFCTSFCPENKTRLYTTCINGTVKRCDLDHLMFENVYSSEGRMVKNHTTWHHMRNSNDLLVAHGDGSVGFIDLRQSMNAVQFYRCHPRSVRTVQAHPKLDQYFVTASGTGEMAVWDARLIKKCAPNPVCKKVMQKGVKSTFFSPDGNLLLTTGIDNHLRIHESVHLVRDFPEIKSIPHNNWTGRWLTPFKAMWHPQRNDVFVVGSMDSVRAVDVYGIHGFLIRKMVDPLLSTILSVVQFHPSLDIIAGANSSGRVHVFKSPN